MSQERENRLQQYLDGRMDAGERERFEQELLADETLMGDAYDEVNVREALAERAHARRMTHKPRRRRSAVGFLAVAVAASLAFFVFVLPRPEREEIFRGGSGRAPQAVAPVGEVAETPDRFVWTGDPLAAHYRLEVFRPGGDRLFVTTTSDTFFVTEESFAMPRAGSWRATAIDSVGVGIRHTGMVDFRTP